MDESAMPTQIEGQQRMSFFSKYKFTIISLCIIIIALVPLVILSKNVKKPATTGQVAQQTTPTQAPLTPQNVEPTLSATDQQVQAALTQTNQDLNQVNQIDSSQDSVAGL